MDSFRKSKYFESDCSVDVRNTNIKARSYIDPYVDSPFVLIEYSLKSEQILVITV